MASTGTDNSFDAESFREGLRIDIISMDDDEMVRSLASLAPVSFRSSSNARVRLLPLVFLLVAVSL
jgi:hypothetical protein